MMPKRGIFIKIYLSFWLATVLAVGAGMGIDRLAEFGPPHIAGSQHALGLVLSTFGPAALKYHMDGDEDGLADFGEEVRESTGVDAYLLHEENTLDDLSLPDDVAAVAVRARQTGKREFSFVNDKAVLVLPLRAEDNTRYYVMGLVSPLAVAPGRPSPSLGLFRLLMVLAISGGVCYVLARYLTSPVIKLTEATRRIAGGDLTVRVAKDIGKRQDELAGLARDFDHMAERVESLMAQQRQLIGDISHELRSPLARLNVALELARCKAGKETVPALNRIETEAGSLDEMIGQLLALTRLETGIEANKVEKVNLADLVTEIADDADFEAHARSCEVRLLECATCRVAGDEELLRRAIENVVRNAVRYTNEGTTIDVALRLTGEGPESWAEISVRDYGQGVPEAALAELFRPFYRVSTARERQSGGTGLGLAITQRAVTLHRGSVTISNCVDGGLIAVIRLPLSP